MSDLGFIGANYLIPPVIMKDAFVEDSKGNIGIDQLQVTNDITLS